MPSLTLVLVIVFAVLIGAVILYNYIQEERFRRQASKMFSRHDEDILLGESVQDGNGADLGTLQVNTSGQNVLTGVAQHAIEAAEAPLPAFHPGRAPGAYSGLDPSAPGNDLEPPDGLPAGITLERTPDDKDSATRPAGKIKPVPVAPPEAELPPPLDPDTECIARLRLVSPSLAGLTALIASLRRIGKPLRAFGLRADGIWAPVQADTRSTYSVVVFGLQLADRSGAVNQDQLNAFCRTLYEFASEDGGAVTCPDKAEILKRAADLDAFCLEVDIIIGLTLSSSDARPFTSEALHGLASEAGMVVAHDGVYESRDAVGRNRFSLCNQESEPFPTDGRGVTTHAVILQLDVPRVADGLAAFDQMSQLAFDLSNRLEGRVVDAKGRAWSNDHLARDRSHLAELYARMQARGIPAGGERALRLFA